MRFLVVLALAACSSAPSPSLGESCKIESTWSSNVCSACRAEALETPCSCAPEVGACNAAFRNLSASTDCTPEVTACASSCGKDCACVEGCYAQHVVCRQLRAELEACVVRACDARCR